ncbi:bacteriophage abortive infection AbiH family protein [Lactococcus garvieae]|uniref:AbiH family protein n=1 Tax=Lactococcus petauri TaxID=1940789 RepID=UPI001BD8F4CC|nr:AbiH family protein [Lactococcus petauri]MBS4465024.1 bacteriophage abortive infection AbiH family protein [Lactococcus garvieae]
MKKLLVIGNGFDIAHDLKTKYSDFKDYILNRGNDMVGYNDQIGIQLGIVLYKFEELCQPKECWNDFESQTEKLIYEVHLNKKLSIFGEKYSANLPLEEWPNLRKRLTETIQSNIGESRISSLGHKLIRELTDEIFNSAATVEYGWIPCLYQAFQDWVTTIDTQEKDKIFKIDKDDYAISFNYTDTLEKLYGLNNVLHLHGSVENVEDIVLGFNSKKLDDDLPGLNTMHTEEFKEEQKAKKQQGLKSLGASLFYRLNIGRFYKPVHQLKKQIKPYVNKLDIDEIVFIGHSYNSIDWPYFKELASNLNDKEFIFTYHSETDKNNINKMIKENDFDINYKIVHVSTYHLSSI